MARIITPAELPRELPVIRELFEAYAQSLGIDLAFQGFDDEVAGLPGKYAEPEGVILLARDGDDVLGCIALRPREPSVCEMKRLYVKPEGRGRAVGRKLALAVIDAARRRGYRRMVLDTLGSMKPAIALYESLGFVQTAPYYANPEPDALYFALSLRRGLA